MKKSRWTKIGLLSMLVVLLMAVGAVAVLAQADDTDSDDDGSALPFGRHGLGEFLGDRTAYLAEALGITTSELENAQQRAHAAMLADAVEEGLLTQDQANLMLATQALSTYLDKDALLAEVLGISVEELQAAREDGTLRDLLADITPAELQERMQAAFEAAVQQAVEDNAITQEQADLVLEAYGNGFAFGHFGHFGERGGHGGFGGFGGGHGRGGFPGMMEEVNPANWNAAAAPSA